jgi:hypothetical protein
MSVIAYDVIVIGAGAAGLTAGARLASEGLRVALVTAGEPTACLSTGCIDVCSAGKNPPGGIADLPESHPYHRISATALRESLRNFQTIAADLNMPYTGDADRNRLVLSAIGTFKTSCLVPVTMRSSPQSAEEKVHIVTFAGLKDFYPGYSLRGLKTPPFPRTTPAFPPRWASRPISKTTHFWKRSSCGWKSSTSAKIKSPFPPCWGWNRRRPSWTRLNSVWNARCLKSPPFRRRCPAAVCSMF